MRQKRWIVRGLGKSCWKNLAKSLKFPLNVRWVDTHQTRVVSKPELSVLFFLLLQDQLSVCAQPKEEWWLLARQSGTSSRRNQTFLLIFIYKNFEIMAKHGEKFQSWIDTIQLLLPETILKKPWGHLYLIAKEDHHLISPHNVTFR